MSGRVLFVGLNGYRLAYTRVRCYRFSEILRERGLDTGVFTLQEAFRPRTHPDRMLQLRDGEKVFLTLLSLCRLLKERGTLLYIQKAHYHAAAPLLLHRLGRNPYVLDYDDWDLDRSTFFDRPALNRLLFGAEGAEGITGRLARDAACCVASTEPLAELLGRYNRRVFHVPTGVDTGLFSPRARPPRQKVTFVWSGVLWGRVVYGCVRFLLEAFREVARREPGVRLLLAGGGWWMPRLKEDVAGEFRGLDIEVRDWVHPDRMPALLLDADVGMLPLIPDAENREWMRCKSPTKLFEYMAMAMPSIASDFGEVKRIVENGVEGFLVPGREGLVARAVELARNPRLRAEMGRRARKRVEEKYALPVLGERLFRIVAGV